MCNNHCLFGAKNSHHIRLLDLLIPDVLIKTIIGYCRKQSSPCSMITRTKINEWLVEPDIEGAREYARLSVSAEAKGINIDGQGIITWRQLELSHMAYATLADSNKKKK
jgi:hypothetical protein